MAKKNEQTILKWALEYHKTGINVLPAFYKGKSPPKGFEWQKYKTQRVTEQELYEWFGDGKWKNISAVTGPISGGLTALDFDSSKAYRWWTKKNPELAKKLPTSKSARGYHVFFRSTLNKDDTASFIKMDIKAKGLVSLPPSMHNSGKRYEWLIPLPDNVSQLPLLNPYDWNLEDFTDGIDGSDGSEGIDGNEGVGKSGLNTLKQFKSKSKRIIIEAIESTLPTGHRQRWKLLFLFARKLKKVEKIKELSADDIMFIADLWHEKALPNIKTKSLIMTQERFKNAWEDAKYPPGNGMSLEIAKEAAFSSAEPMAELKDYEGEKVIEKIIRLCFELQRLAGPDDVWFLPTNKAYELFGISHSWLSTLLNKLCNDTIIKKMKKHTKHRCTRYKYIGPSIAFLQQKDGKKK
ncbi:bifunctional DNA primase/polymerase [Planctomycetota bacterium]